MGPPYPIKSLINLLESIDSHLWSISPNFELVILLFLSANQSSFSDCSHIAFSILTTSLGDSIIYLVLQSYLVMSPRH